MRVLVTRREIVKPTGVLMVGVGAKSEVEVKVDRWCCLRWKEREDQTGLAPTTVPPPHAILSHYNTVPYALPYCTLYR